MQPLPMSPQNAERYYYEKDVVFGPGNNSEWYGKGAEALNLKGNINQYVFRKLSYGFLPEGTKCMIKKGRTNPRAGIDMPLAPPKSISIMALIGNDNRLIKAHQEAVKETISYIENRYIHTRKTTNKKTKIKKHRKGIFATFMHGTSRANDPQLHTHVFLFNMVKTSKLKWQALHNDAIFKNRSLIANVYRNFLKRKVKNLGYGIRNTAKAFEIEGVERRYIENFSKRDKQIKTKEKEIDNKKILIGKVAKRKIAYLDTRKNKNTKIKIEDLKKDWKKQIDLKELLQKVEKGKTTNHENPLHYSRFDEKINILSDLLCEKEAVFKTGFLLLTVMKVLDVDIYKAEKFVSRAEKEGQFVIVKKGVKKEKAETLWTTKKMIEIEKGIVQDFKDGKKCIPSILKKELLTKELDVTFAYLTNGQKEAVVHSLDSNDRFSIIQGDAGTGKTASMVAVKNILEKQINQISKTISEKIREDTFLKVDPEKIKNVILKTGIEGMGFTGKAAMELEKGSGIKSSTIHQFLNKGNQFDLECLVEGVNKEEKTLFKKHFNPIWIVDEASMIASTQMKQIIEKAKVENAKVIFIGDGKQLSSIGAGRMFSDLQELNTVKTIKMDKVMRQKTSHMKKIVSLVKTHIEEKNIDETKHLKQAFDILSETNSIQKLTDGDEKLKIIAQDYVKRKDMTNTLVVCSDNKTKENINLEIRSTLKIKEDKEQTFICRTPVSFGGINKYYAESYEKGSKIFIQKGNDKVRAGQTLEIEHVDTQGNILTCKNGDRKIKINPLKDMIENNENNLAISAFREQEKKIRIGEKIVFCKNDRKLNVQNGLTGTVKSIGKEGKLSINIDGSDKTVSFHSKHYAWLDYGYAVTVHKSQGQTCDHVMFASTKKTSFMDTSEALYVAATRAKKSMSVYSDQIVDLHERFKQMKEKTSTLDYSMGR